MNFTFRDDVQGFVSKWDDVLLSMKETQNENFLESIYHTRVRESVQLKTTFASGNHDTVHKG